MDRAIYGRPNKAYTLPVRRRQGAPFGALPALPEPLTVDRYTECHVTPPDVAARMVEYLGTIAGTSLLEPSAGTGALIAAVNASAQEPSVMVAVEREVTLHQGLHRRFESQLDLHIIQGCFLEHVAWYADQQRYQKIVLNPPFRACRAHLAAALSVLDRSGGAQATIVALVPDVDSSHSVLDSAEVLERLPAGTFASTDARTRIVRFCR